MELGLFGDNSSARVIAIDIDKWAHIRDILVGDGPYPVDKVS